MNWQCPYCGRHAVLTENSYCVAKGRVDVGAVSSEGDLKYAMSRVVCPNPECRQSVLETRIWKYHVYWSPEQNSNVEEEGDDIYRAQLVPRGLARAFPDAVPAKLRSDYEEACLILQSSPKASAALSRRCLQGLIRSYFMISKGTLQAEIDALQDKISSELWDAVDAIRKVGNVGAHPERDVDRIVDVSPEAAQALIQLIELLFEETFVRDLERQQRIERAKGAAAEIEKQKNG